MLICTPEVYLSDSGAVHCCAINGYRVKHSSERADTLIAYSADPQRLGEPNYRVCRRSEVPSNGIWLLSLDREGAQQPYRQEVLQQFSPIEDYDPLRERLSRTWARLWDDAGGIYSPSDPCARSSLASVIVSVLLLAPSLVILPAIQKPLRAYMPSGSYIVCAYVALFLAYVWVFYISARLSSLLVRQLDASPRWTATTIRCLADGAHLRNGLYRHLRRRQRTQIQPD